MLYVFYYFYILFILKGFQYKNYIQLQLFHYFLLINSTLFLMKYYIDLKLIQSFFRNHKLIQYYYKPILFNFILNFIVEKMKLLIF